ARGQLDQPAAVVGVNLSKDGTRLAVARADKTVGVWTLADSKEVAKVTAPAEVRGVGISPDGQTVAVATADNRVRTYGGDGKPREAFLHDGPATGVAFHPDGKQIVTASADKTARLWTPALVAQTTLAGPARQAVFTPQGDRYLVVGDDKTLRLFDGGTGAEQKAIPAHDGAVLGVSLSADAAKAATVGADKKAKVWSLADGKEVAAIALAGAPEAVALSPDAARLAVAYLDGKTYRVRAYDVAGGQELQAVADAPGAVRALGFGPDNRTLLWAGDDKAAVLADVAVRKVLAAHPGGAVGVAFHSNGSQAFTAGKDKTVKLWDLNAGKEVRSFGPLPEPAACLAVSRDFSQVGAGSGKVLKIWNVADGKEIATLTHPAEVTSADFSGDKGRVVTGAADNLARVWEVATGKELQAFRFGAAVRGVAYHPNQQAVAAGGDDKTAAVHTPDVVRLVSASPAPLRAVTVSANGAHVFTGGDEKVVKAWNTGNGNADRTFAGATAAVRAVAVSKNNQVVATGGDDKTVRVYRFDNGELVGTIEAPGAVRGLEFHPNGQALAAACDGDAVVAWNVAFNPGQPLPPEFGSPVQSFTHPGGPAAVAFAAGGALFSGGADKTVKEWKLASDAPVKNLGHPNLVDAVAFDPEGKLLATGCHDGRVRLFDVAKGAQVRQIDAHIQPQPSPVYAVAFSPDGQQVVSGSYDKSLKLWNVADGKLIREFKAFDEKDAPKGHRAGVFCVAFSPDGKFIASGSSDRTLKLWEVGSGNVVREFADPNYKPGPLPGPPHAHPGWVYKVRFIDNGAKLVSVGSAPRYRGYVAVWNVADGKQLAAVEAPTGAVHGLGVSADGGTLVLACGPKERGRPEADAVILKTPGK
ncbi:MAG TPA: WD40 repeat domain-containing protein, partial [Gemmataceae bacterium]